jgi:hypothetical protein
VLSRKSKKAEALRDKAEPRIAMRGRKQEQRDDREKLQPLVISRQRHAIKELAQ